MKHLNRFLAILLAVLMLCGMFSAVAEMEVTLDAPQDIENIELDTDDAPDVSLDLDDLNSLDLEDPGLVSEAPEAAIASNAGEAPEDNASPFRINKYGVLVKYTGSDSLVVIPKSVVDIKSKAFAGNDSIQSVVIPETVTTIHAQAFVNCVNLSSVTVLARDITIANSAFNGETPSFYTVVNSSAAEFATSRGFYVESNLILMNQNYTLTTSPNKTYRIYINDGQAVSYISNNPSVATVNASGIVQTVNSGNAQITVTLSNGVSRLLTIYVQAPTASLSPTSMTMKVGESRTITVNGLSGRTVTWSSSNANVASVNGGTVYAKAAGSCIITARLSDGTTLPCSVTVQSEPQKKAYLSKTSFNLYVGQTGMLYVRNLGNRTVTWSSSNANVASVNGGKVSAKAVGSCTITARLSDGTTLTCKVTVTQKSQPQKKPSLNKTTLNLKVGDSYTLVVNNRGNRSVTWSSSNANVASVDGGKVSAKAAGSCTVTARLSDGITLNCKVNVTQKSQPQKKPSLNKTTLNLKVGNSYTLVVNNRGNRSVTWSSNYPNVASVSSGKVSAKAAGSCTITARLSDGTTLTCKVTVTQKSQPQKKPSLNKTRYTLRVGQTFKLVVNNLGNNKVTWESNNDNIATVDQFGMITAVKTGKCIISAKLSNGTVLKCNVTVRR